MISGICYTLMEENNWDSHVLTENNVSERDRREVPKFFYRYLGAKRFLDKANQNCFQDRVSACLVSRRLFCLYQA